MIRQISLKGKKLSEFKLLGQLSRKADTTQTKTPCDFFLNARYSNLPFCSLALIFLLFLQKRSQMTTE